MSGAYLIGHIRVQDPEAWARYRAQVPATLAPWGAELVFRGTRTETFAGDDGPPDLVIIRFPDAAAARGWHGSAAYQALIPLRRQAAEMGLTLYEG